MSFQVHALPAAPFAHYFDLSDAELEARGARRVIAPSDSGYPCRVSLRDVDAGAELVLVNHQHVEGNTPYAASHAIYVSKDAQQAHPAPGEVPEVLSSRLLSVRGFDAQRMIVDADVVPGTDLAATLTALFANPEVEGIDIHNAKRGCFAAHVTRA